MQLLTLGRCLDAGMNKMMSIGNEQVIDIAEFIACLEPEGGVVHALLSILAFREQPPGELKSRGTAPKWAWR